MGQQNFKMRKSWKSWENAIMGDNNEKKYNLIIYVISQEGLLRDNLKEIKCGWCGPSIDY